MGEGTGFARAGAGLLHDFFGDRAVALHHIARNLFVAVVRGVGDDLPAVGGGQARSFGHRIVVVARDAHDLRATVGDGLLALQAHLGVQHDLAAAAGIARGDGQGAAVVAVGGADDGVVRELGCVAPVQHGGGLEARVQPQDLAHQGDRRAQGLEAAQRRAQRFILDAQARHPQARRQLGQIVQRRRAARDLPPVRQPQAAFVGAREVHDRAQRGGVWGAHGAWVGDQHADGCGLGNGGRRRRRAADDRHPAAWTTLVRPWSRPCRCSAARVGASAAPRHLRQIGRKRLSSVRQQLSFV